MFTASDSFFIIAEGFLRISGYKRVHSPSNEDVAWHGDVNAHAMKSQKSKFIAPLILYIGSR